MRHDHEIPICAKDILEIESGIDKRGHHVSHNAAIFSMQNGGAGQDAQKELNVRRVRKIACHRLKHPGNQPNPHELVQHIQAEQFLAQLTALVQLQIGFECFPGEGWQFH